jgi:WD40 repeat protein
LICKWVSETGKFNFAMLGHTERVNHMCATKVKAQQHESIYSSSSDCTVRQWDPMTGHCLNIYKFADPVVFSMFQPSSDFLITASDDQIIRIVDLERFSI